MRTLLSIFLGLTLLLVGRGVFAQTPVVYVSTENPPQNLLVKRGTEIYFIGRREEVVADVIVRVGNEDYKKTRFFGKRWRMLWETKGLDGATYAVRVVQVRPGSKVEESLIPLMYVKLYDKAPYSVSFTDKNTTQESVGLSLNRLEQRVGVEAEIDLTKAKALLDGMPVAESEFAKDGKGTAVVAGAKPGKHLLSAQVILPEDAGTLVTEPVTVTVLPFVEIGELPQNGVVHYDTNLEPVAMPLKATVTEGETPERIEFFMDETKIGEASVADPVFTLQTASVPAGEYLVYAVATTKGGRKYRSGDAVLSIRRNAAFEMEAWKGQVQAMRDQTAQAELAFEATQKRLTSGEAVLPELAAGAKVLQQEYERQAEAVVAIPMTPGIISGKQELLQKAAALYAESFRQKARYWQGQVGALTRLQTYKADPELMRVRYASQEAQQYATGPQAPVRLAGEALQAAQMAVRDAERYVEPEGEE